jgi:hypothetical protein
MASGGWVGLSPAVRGDVVHAASKSVHDEAGASRDLVLPGTASAYPSDAMLSIRALQQTAGACRLSGVHRPRARRIGELGRSAAEEST